MEYMEYTLELHYVQEKWKDVVARNHALYFGCMGNGSETIGEVLDEWGLAPEIRMTEEQMDAEGNQGVLIPILFLNQQEEYDEIVKIYERFQIVGYKMDSLNHVLVVELSGKMADAIACESIARSPYLEWAKFKEREDEDDLWDIPEDEDFYKDAC